MGLDISVYRQLQTAENPELDSDGCPVDWENVRQIHPQTLAWQDEHFPGRSEGLSAGYFTFAESDGFRAGSYSGYNRWRDMLAIYAGHGSASRLHNMPHSKVAGPFVELINFADNEGYIGPVVSAKLAKDFAEHEAAILAKAGDDELETWFIDLYRTWRKAFEMAADGGCVDFH